MRGRKRGTCTVSFSSAFILQATKAKQTKPNQQAKSMPSIRRIVLDTNDIGALKVLYGDTNQDELLLSFSERHMLMKQRKKNHGLYSIPRDEFAQDDRTTHKRRQLQAKLKLRKEAKATAAMK